MAQLDTLLKKMVSSGASDLHLSCGEPVRMRINGELKRVSKSPLDQTSMYEMMKELCRPDQWTKFREVHELDFAYGIQDVSRFRCNYLQQVRGPGAVFRVIPDEIIPLEKLGVPKVLASLANLKSGLVLVTGPTGSGKSTTLAGLINLINRRHAKHIITIEDPIEFVHRSEKSFIYQREVGADALSFSSALHESLLQDPDVILVGEMRDLETISQAVTAAEMGVLVFGTLHTNSAAKTMDRIIDTFPAAQKEQIRGMLSESLKAIVAQQLLKRSDKPGRVAAHEVLLHGPGLGNIIREGSTPKMLSYIESGKGRGMCMMDESLIALVKNNIVTAEDAFLKATDKLRFEKWLHELNIPFSG
ncbi:MAG: type IV pilus twitching motility protein PilT [Myxococcales bacterium]|nr:type IV pilus twitching motility protein PilT [Myxococcales bacterium]